MLLDLLISRMIDGQFPAGASSRRVHKHRFERDRLTNGQASGVALERAIARGEDSDRQGQGGRLVQQSNSGNERFASTDGGAMQICPTLILSFCGGFPDVVSLLSGQANWS
jgi:3-oxoacyl-ACP reductase-like protein